MIASYPRVNNLIVGDVESAVNFNNIYSSLLIKKPSVHASAGAQVKFIDLQRKPSRVAL